MKSARRSPFRIFDVLVVFLLFPPPPVGGVAFRLTSQHEHIYISIPSFVEASFQIFSLPNSRVIAKAPESQQDSRECAIPYPHKVWPTIVEHTLHEASGVGGDGTSEPVRQMTPVFALWRNRQALPHRPSTLRQAL